MSTPGPEYPGLFKGKAGKGKGKNWLASLPTEDRAIFSKLGRMALSLRDINWHALGGKERAKHRCSDCGRIIGKNICVCKRDKGDGNE